jgi:hypothetical protein
MASALGTGVGAAETGYGLSMDPSLNLQSPLTEMGPDQQAIQQQMGTQQGMTNQYMQQLGQNANQDYSNLTSQLAPSGQLGQQLAGEYNNYGITPNSGAFQEGLGNQYGQMMNQVNAQQASALGQGYQTQSGLGMTGLQNTMGLESQGVDTTNAQALAQFMQQAGLQQALVGGGLNTVGQSASGGKG